MIRRGFVANSSSSSFVCDICGEADSDYDSLYDADMVSCENNHKFCACHLDTKEFAKNLREYAMKTIDRELYNWEEIDELFDTIDRMANNRRISTMDIPYINDNHTFIYDMPEKYCPICQGKIVTDKTLVRYIRTYDKNLYDELLGEIKEDIKALGYKAFAKELK